MAKKKSGGETPAVRVLTEAGVAHTLHTYDAADRTRDGRDVPFGEEAAAAIGAAPESVFKTLLADVDGALWVAVVPVSGMLDLKALAAAAGGKRAAMADPVVAERTTGYVVGGISPLGQRRRLPTVVDATAQDRATVFVSGGKRGLDVELASVDLVRLTQARVAPIATRR